MLNGLETTVYYVADIAAASVWYRKVLGVDPNYEAPYYVGFTVAGDEFGLHPADDHRRPGDGGQEALWSVVDLRAAIAHFVEHGAKELRCQEVGGGVWVGAVLDPFGNSLGLIQNPNSPNKR